MHRHLPSPPSASRFLKHKPGQAGFTLVEILIVVVILGILAAIVIPQFASAANTSRDSAAKATLTRVRKQIEIYRNQHNEPPTLANFQNQMTLSTNAAGTTAAVGTTGFRFGPYIRDMPVNPYTSGNTIGAGAVESSDWYYDEDTGEFLCNDSEEHREF